MTYHFNVVPDDIATAADTLSDLGAGSTKAVDYAKRYLDLEGNAGLVLKPLIGVLQEACDEFATKYTRLGTRTSETRKPNRDHVVTPDEDDLYFRDRNQRGWLR